MEKKIIIIIVFVLLTSGNLHAVDNSFFDNGDGTVTDRSMGLMWQQPTAPGIYSWSKAESYCDNLILNNDGKWTTGTANATGSKYDDWRLPSVIELESLVDRSLDWPWIVDHRFFPDTMMSFYWSSTPHDSNAYLAKVVGYAFGYTFTSFKFFRFLVRAVRSETCLSFGDSDGDGICDDGDASGIIGDNLCAGGNTVSCDDNCPDTSNSRQLDTDNDSIGDACGSCGDGGIAVGEECDDGGTSDNDGCSSECLIETPDEVDVTVNTQDNNDGTYSYEIIDNNTNNSIITVKNNRGQMDLSSFNYAYDFDDTDDTVSLEIKGLDLNDTTKEIVLPFVGSYCVVDTQNSSAGDFTWETCISDDSRIMWTADVNPCISDSLTPGRDKDGIVQEQYTCENFEDDGKTYVRLSGFTHTDAVGFTTCSQPGVCDNDGDAVVNEYDNCPDISNSGQNDIDKDGVGDVCDDDKDGDNVINENDNCPFVPNSDQADSDGDLFGDVCDDCPDNDPDNDALCGNADNCPAISNPNQDDVDNDGIGDACDANTFYGYISGDIKEGINVNLYEVFCAQDVLIDTAVTDSRGYFSLVPNTRDAFFTVVPEDDEYSFELKFLDNFAFPLDFRYVWNPQTEWFYIVIPMNQNPIKAYNFIATKIQ